MAEDLRPGTLVCLPGVHPYPPHPGVVLGPTNRAGIVWVQVSRVRVRLPVCLLEVIHG